MTPAALLWGAGFGVVASVPTGPVAVLVVRNTLAGGTRAGLATAVALVAGELVYVVLFGVGLADLVLRTAWLRDGLFLGGAALLFAVGVKALRARPAADEPAVTATTLGGHFRTGLVLTLTNPAMLLLIAGYLASARAIFGDTLVRDGLWPLLLAMEVGTAAWFFTLVHGLARLPARLAEPARRRADRVAGVALIGFSAWLAFDTLSTVFG